MGDVQKDIGNHDWEFRKKYLGIYGYYRVIYVLYYMLVRLYIGIYAVLMHYLG